MEKHGTKRSRPEALVEGTVGIISVRMDYLDKDAANASVILNQPEKTYIACYALGEAKTGSACSRSFFCARGDANINRIYFVRLLGAHNVRQCVDRFLSIMQLENEYRRARFQLKNIFATNWQKNTS